MPSGPHIHPRWAVRLVLAALIAVTAALALQAQPAGGQETCNAEGVCTIPPLVIERAEPVVAAPEFTG